MSTRGPSGSRKAPRTFGPPTVIVQTTPLAAINGAPDESTTRMVVLMRVALPREIALRRAQLGNQFADRDVELLSRSERVRRLFRLTVAVSNVDAAIRPASEMRRENLNATGNQVGRTIRLAEREAGNMLDAILFMVAHGHLLGCWRARS